MTMPRMPIAPGGPEFSRVIYGTWRLLSNQPSAQEINRRLHACVELGITTIDTAEIYGVYEVELALGAEREYQSICRSAVHCQRSAVTNRAPAAAAKNSRTAAAEWPDILIPAQPVIRIEAARVRR